MPFNQPDSIEIIFFLKQAVDVRIGKSRVSAIDKDNLPYNIPVDLVIDQYNPRSWKDGAKHIIARANESVNPTVVLLQHEYGLDPDAKGNDSNGTNYIEMAKAFSKKGLTTLVYLHTVLEQPDPHQKMVLQELAKHSNGLIVITESAINLLLTLAGGTIGISMGLVIPSLVSRFTKMSTIVTNSSLLLAFGISA